MLTIFLWACERRVDVFGHWDDTGDETQAQTGRTCRRTMKNSQSEPQYKLVIV